MGNKSRHQDIINPFKCSHPPAEDVITVTTSFSHAELKKVPSPCKKRMKDHERHTEEMRREVAKCVPELEQWTLSEEEEETMGFDSDSLSCESDETVYDGEDLDLPIRDGEMSDMLNAAGKRALQTPGGAGPPPKRRLRSSHAEEQRRQQIEQRIQELEDHVRFELVIKGVY